MNKRPCVDTRVGHKTNEEDYEYEDNNPNILSDKNHQVLSPKFWQILCKSS